MSDVVMQNLISDVFWFALMLTVIGFFRREIKNLMNSLGSFKVAGASFELKDSRATIESYVALTNIVTDILTDRENAIKFGTLLSNLNVHYLSQFALTYAKDVPEDPKQLELVTNIAWLISNRGDSESALKFYNAVLKQHPENLDILNLKAGALIANITPEALLECEGIMDKLVAARPKDAQYRNNRAIIKCKLGKLPDALTDLELAVDLGYWRQDPYMLRADDFDPIRTDPRFQALETKLAEILRPGSRPEIR